MFSSRVRTEQSSARLTGYIEFRNIHRRRRRLWCCVQIARRPIAVIKIAIPLSVLSSPRNDVSLATCASLLRRSNVRRSAAIIGEAKVFVAGNGHRKFRGPCRSETLLSGNRGSSGKVIAYGAGDSSRNFDQRREDRSSHNDAEMTTYFANSDGTRGSPVRKVRLFCF